MSLSIVNAWSTLHHLSSWNHIASGTWPCIRISPELMDWVIPDLAPYSTWHARNVDCKDMNFIQVKGCSAMWLVRAVHLPYNPAKRGLSVNSGCETKCSLICAVCSATVPNFQFTLMHSYIDMEVRTPLSEWLASMTSHSKKIFWCTQFLGFFLAWGHEG